MTSKKTTTLSLDELPEDLEGALRALEVAVKKLEEPELPLEESLSYFEKGTKLAEICYARLKEADKKVEVLMKKVPKPTTKDDFATEDLKPYD